MQDLGPNDAPPPIAGREPSPVVAPPSSLAGGDPPTIRSARVEGSSLARGGAPQALLMPSPGDRLESFELERPIGSGGMGAVFLAIDSRLHREVALKVLPPEQSNDSEVVQRFYQEGRAAARLDHENIARVFTIGADKGFHFIAFEYIEGATLRQRVEEHGPLRVDEAINYTLQIASALVHASERGVVHRDIKPSNIIVTPQGRAKLVDMGLARSFERGHHDDGLTQSGMTLGTFDYISPEQARDPRSVDVRGDLYSLGCTLFHMLTGRPPFPEGTVLQKLLQHQEEPPPDVRELNPAVPPALATILVKLMAKERERRYQTPELLVRDLLTVAGALGLRSLSPEGLVWLSPRPPSWEKHLVWGIPAAALAAAVFVLGWWGRPAEAPATPEPPPSAAPAVVVATRPEPAPAEPKDRPAPAATARVAEPAAVPPRLRPREVRLKAGDDLAAALAREASGSTLILGDDGPYPLAPASAPAKGRRDLTIRAAPEARPVLRPARGGASTASGVAALLAFGPGTVAIEGVEFLLDAPEADVAWSAIRAEGTDLTLKRCSFRRAPGRAPMARQSAIRIRPPASASAAAGEPRTSLLADSCHVDPGLAGLWASGPADLRLRDVTFGPGEPAAWLDNGGAADLVPVELSLSHCSLQVGSGPAFRASRTALRAIVDHSAVATLRDRTATLVATDEPAALDWRGKANVYSGIATYLETTGKVPGREPVRELPAWADDPEAYREVDSQAVEGPIWETADSLLGFSRRVPSSAFALRRAGKMPADLGARRGPHGRIVAPGDGLAGLIGFEIPGRSAKPPPAPRAAAPAARPAETPATEKIRPDPAEKPEAAGDPPAPEPMPMARPEDLPPADRIPDEAAPMPHPDDAVPGIAADRINEGPPRGAAVAAPAMPEVLRTAAEFLAAIDRLGPRGGTLTLATDADIALGPVEFRGMGRWIIQAEATGVGLGARRPRLRFTPAPADPRAESRRPSLFTVRASGLELQGIDVLLPDPGGPERVGGSAFALGSGADLALSRCTVTATDRARGTTLVAVLGDEEGDERPAGRDSSAVQVRVTDGLLRSEGDVIDVAAGRGVKATFTNVVIGSGGSLAHGHGMTRGLSPEPIELDLRQVTARVSGGVAFLESAPGAPELPAAQIAARDTILTTDGLAAPMIRIDGQEDLESLRDRVSWEGHGVIYHQVDVYRLDQSARAGTLPQRFRRPSWDMAVAPRDDSPLTGDVKFAKEWDLDRSPATLGRDDAALDPDGPAPTAGPDLGRIPDAPPLSTGRASRGK